MDKQRLRNLTTGRLHTEMDHVYQDYEYITGSPGIMTHMLPNIHKAVEPWLKEKVPDPEYWDGEFRPDLEGDYHLEPMTKEESDAMFQRYGNFLTLFHC